MVKASDLIKAQEKRESTRKKTYKKILERIFTKIELSSAANLYQCWYEIPEFILGLPIYKMDECKTYICRKLTKNGFEIGHLNYNSILISWQKN